ncbi:hypothetical protein ACFQ4L_02590 [Lapidilactobacillus mulanensis]|uniref:Uncharacterized protein n=1 Tax=Lapidilactobacillus mulanensis TaxID=2485999 RepID=A0ABW4DPW9_9LACO|nr:hypothetical protein [Lapidilactobacillus mulanensis]
MNNFRFNSTQRVVSLVVLTISLWILDQLIDWPWLIYVVLASLLLTVITLIGTLIYELLLNKH